MRKYGPCYAASVVKHVNCLPDLMQLSYACEEVKPHTRFVALTAAVAYAMRSTAKCSAYASIVA